MCKAVRVHERRTPVSARAALAGEVCRSRAPVNSHTLSIVSVKTILIFQSFSFQNVENVIEHTSPGINTVTPLPECCRPPSRPLLTPLFAPTVPSWGLIYREELCSPPVFKIHTGVVFADTQVKIHHVKYYFFCRTLILKKLWAYEERYFKPT